MCVRCLVVVRVESLYSIDSERVNSSTHHREREREREKQSKSLNLSKVAYIDHIITHITCLSTHIIYILREREIIMMMMMTRRCLRSTSIRFRTYKSKKNFPKEIRMVGLNGENMGVVSYKSALEDAKNDKMGLLCVNGTSDPPVYRLMSRSDIHRKEKADRKKKHAQKPKPTKQITFNVKIHDHDRNTKVRLFFLLYIPCSNIDGEKQTNTHTHNTGKKNRSIFAKRTSCSSMCQLSTSRELE